MEYKRLGVYIIYIFIFALLINNIFIDIVNIPRSGERGIVVSQNYIFSGAVTPMRAMPLARTERTVSASLSRAARTCSSSPLMRQEL